MTESLMYGDDAYEVHDAAVKSVSLLTSLIPGEVISFAGFRVTVLLEEVMVCKRCLALLVACVVILSPDAASADQSQTLNDHEDEYTITIKSPNLTVTSDVQLCTSVRLPVDPAFIIRVRPKPMPGVHHHMVLFACQASGYPASEASVEGPNVWECDDFSDSEPKTHLPQGPDCSPSGGSYFSTQFQGGSVDEGSLLLPPGTGVPVGDGTDFHTIVALFHFFKPDELVNRSTAGAAIDVTFLRTRNNSQIIPVSSLLLDVNGVVAANSVGRVSGSWTLKEKTVMRLLKLFTHWHQMNDMAIEIQVWIERPNGQKDVILAQDPHTFTGITDVSNSSSAVMRKGDHLVIECTYNNTKVTSLRVENQDMCILEAFYVTEDNRSLENRK